MDTLTALKTRRSVRKFTREEVPEGHLREIVDCARLAATARNEQPWEFVVVRTPALRGEIARLADYGRFIAEAPACLAVFCKETKYYLEDGAAATENSLLAAQALGLGTCWVAGDKKEYAEAVRQLLGVPMGYKLISLVAIGYPAEGKVAGPPKRRLEEVLHWEKFSRN
ncbi:MAG TPA: nitroreductase family protein [Firmicutes bacterium]|jgi:nitroreductase|nr:nitroreductase family protein [Bacillota bacterium]